MKAVHFGAGNIGRGFIGLTLSQAGYEVCFVDVNDQIVSLLQQRRSYTVKLANDTGDETRVSGVTALHGSRAEQVAAAIAEADLVTTAVGVGALKHVAPALAQGIALRLAQSDAPPLHVIACENTIGGSAQLKGLTYALLNESFIRQAEQRTAFPDAAVDRIVPIQQNEDPLEVVVEPFFEWVVDESALLEGAGRIDGIHYVPDLEPYIERKLFTVNTGHCVAAYHGYLAGYRTIQEVMADGKLKDEVLRTLMETGDMLVRRHSWDSREHRRYVERILERFANPHLTDEVARVGRSPIRKLSPQDRLVRPARLAHESGLPTEQLASGMAAALFFDAPDDPEAASLQAELAEEGPSAVIERYTGLPSGHPILRQALARYEVYLQLRTKGEET
ncbi:mannitol-1-phosphate 5-dehydrogenase [Cohnella boryungensis]|uniref:Mannitol-1-phosphate 5-dehydrogenase n=1 Tax=Cohnella boryungensis TaxID=768479 RepID=A0ABV8SAN3_9BACL